MIQFPGGDFRQGERLSFEGLQAPFGVATDDQNRIWVSSSFNNKLTVIEGDSPDQYKTVTVALGARGLAIDSKGNAWLSQQSNSPTGSTSCRCGHASWYTQPTSTAQDNHGRI